MSFETIAAKWKSQVSHRLGVEKRATGSTLSPVFRPELYDILKNDVVYIDSAHGDYADGRRFWAPLQSRFEHQLRKGCGSLTCTQPTCRTHRSRSRSKPLRQLTEASISATALMLSQDPQAERHLCSNKLTLDKINLDRAKLPEDPADPSSFVQNMLATTTMRSALEHQRMLYKTSSSGYESTQKLSRPELPVLSKLELQSIQAVLDLILSPPICSAGQSTQVWKFLERSCEYVFSDPWRLYSSFHERLPKSVLMDLNETSTHQRHPSMRQNFGERVTTERRHESICSADLALHVIYALFGHQLINWLTKAVEQLGCSVNTRNMSEGPRHSSNDKADRGTASLDEVFVYSLRMVCQVLTLGPTVKTFINHSVRGENSNSSIGLVQVLDKDFLDLSQLVANRLAPWWDGSLTANTTSHTSHLRSRDMHELIRTKLWTRLTRPISHQPEENLDAESQHYTPTMESLVFWLGVLCQAGTGGITAVRCGSPLDNAIFVLGQIVRKLSNVHDLSGLEGYWDSERFQKLVSPLGPLCDPDELVKSWLYPQPNHRPLLEYPFLLSGSATSAGTRGLVLCFRRICFIRMMKVYRAATLNNKMINAGFCWPTVAGLPDTQEQLDSLVHQHMPRGIKSALMPQLEIKVRRKTMLDDALNHVWRRQKRHLLAPLKVKFGDAGEIAADLGGVAQEFFRLVAEKMQSPEYGLFTLSGPKQFAWFNPGSSEPSYRYCLLGILVALAVHNGFTLPISFPSLLYRRLLDPTCGHGGLEGIEDGWPELVKGLRNLLEYGGDVEEDIGVDYTFPISLPGQTISVPMNKDTATLVSSRSLDCTKLASVVNAEVPSVTNTNRQQYVLDYVDFLTSSTVKEQWSEFAKGFHSILDPSILATLTWQALRVLVEGHQDIDMLELQSATQYVQYSSQDNTIRLFWAYVADLSTDRLKKLLEFVTATDRVPVNGLESLGFTIQKHGEDDDHLPSASTCFGILLLPAYSSAGVLAKKMDQALDNSEGFGLR